MLFCFGERDKLSQKMKKGENGLDLSRCEGGIGEKNKPKM